MRTGLYALAGFDASPLAPDDLAMLGLPLDEGGPTFLRARAEDAERLGAAHSVRTGDGWCIFLGELEDAEAAATTLECDADPAVIAQAAVRRWGPRASDLLKGEWSLLCQERAGAPLWLGASRLLRDRIYFAFDGHRIGISGDLVRLAALSWVDGMLDPQGVAYGVSTWAVRQRSAGSTVLRGIRELEAGQFHRFSFDGAHDVHRPGPDIACPWRGSFDDAVASLEQRLRTVVSAILSRHDRVAIFMSGGLDSALLARFVAETRRSDQAVIALTAVAPPGSARDDERALAADIARAFDIPHRLIWPDENARIFHPKARHFSNGELSLSPRHYLYDALFDAARAFGATAVIEGVAGEAAVSRHEPEVSLPDRLRGIARWLRDVDRHRRDASSGSASNFQVRLAPTLLRALPPGFAATSGPAFPRLWPRSPRAPMGWPSNHHKQWRTPSSVPGEGFRRLRPLRDRELITMVAGMPAHFTDRDGCDRALARAMLQGHVPESVYLQPKGLAFSVDYIDRILKEAPLVLDRLPALRREGVSQWLDLDWLEGAVRRLIENGFESVEDTFRVQLTAIAAEYFYEWRQYGPY